MGLYCTPSATKGIKKRIIDRWIEDELSDGRLSARDLETRFKVFFFGRPIRMLSITGFSYQPQSAEDLKSRLNRLVSMGRIAIEGDKYVVARP